MATELGLRTTARVVRRSLATEELGFKDFIRRAQVKAQYREMLRLARRYARARPADGADVLRQVRDGYRRHSSERDGFAVAQLISGGRASLRELRALAAGADDAGPNDAYEVGTDWPWTADQSVPTSYASSGPASSAPAAKALSSRSDALPPEMSWATAKPSLSEAWRR